MMHYKTFQSNEKCLIRSDFKAVHDRVLQFIKEATNDDVTEASLR